MYTKTDKETQDNNEQQQATAIKVIKTKTKIKTKKPSKGRGSSSRTAPTTTHASVLLCPLVSVNAPIGYVFFATASAAILAMRLYEHNKRKEKGRRLCFLNILSPGAALAPR